ncbi:MAG: NAD-dependent epimerase/dehydratase family protein [Chloroflexi bacterium]|nr:NAD-dependent epimerase/dehydratase family protein [Chloroflexota bacterium]
MNQPPSQLPVSSFQSPISNLQSPTLLTGVTGFIAGHLAERLLAEGVRVRGTARRPETFTQTFEVSETSKVSRGIEVVQADLLDADSLRRAATGCRAVVHAAAWTGGPELSEELAWRTNVEGTANVLAAARAAGVERFVYISSVAVYGLNCAALIDESMPTPQVGQLYPDSKIGAEAAVRASGLPWVIVRPASTYGPHATAWTIGPIAQIKAGRLVLLGRDHGLVTPGYIDNVVDGLWLTLTHPAAVGEAFNLCDDRAVTYREFYLAYARMLGLESLPTVPAWLALLARTAPANLLRRLLGRPPIGPWSLHLRRNPSQFSVMKAQRLLGYTVQVDFAEGMRRTEAWLRAAGRL